MGYETTAALGGALPGDLYGVPERSREHSGTYAGALVVNPRVDQAARVRITD